VQKKLANNTKCTTCMTQGTLVPSSDNGKIAIQLITSTRRTRNPKFVQIGPKGAPGEIREI